MSPCNQNIPQQIHVHEMLILQASRRQKLWHYGGFYSDFQGKARGQEMLSMTSFPMAVPKKTEALRAKMQR